MVRKFSNYTANIFRSGKFLKDWSLLKWETKIFENIPIALWKSSKNYNDTSLANETSKNSYEINLESKYHDIKVWDMIEVQNLWKFVIEQIILHHNHCGILDNIQVFVTEKI